MSVEIMLGREVKVITNLFFSTVVVDKTSDHHHFSFVRISIFLTIGRGYVNCL